MTKRQAPPTPPTATTGPDFTTDEIFEFHEKIDDNPDGFVDTYLYRCVSDAKDRDLVRMGSEEMIRGGLTEREALLLMWAASEGRGDLRGAMVILFAAGDGFNR